MMPENVFHNPVFDRIDDAKRQRILDAAIQEFSDKGFAPANINVIAEKAGISIGSMYKYFKSKEDLYLTVVNLGLSYLETTLMPIIEARCSLGEKLAMIVDAIFDSAGEFDAMNRLYNRFTTESNSDLAGKLARSLETITATAYAALLEQAKKEGVTGGGISERVFAFCMDNVFLVLQFSMSSEYYRDRMRIYLGDDIAGDSELLKGQVLLFLKNALGLKETAGGMQNDHSV